MAEKIDVLNDAGLRTGEVLERDAIHRYGHIHRAVHLYLFNQTGQLLLQKRTENADHYPGLFSISVAGHIEAGEISGDAVRRELHEELGLNPDGMDIRFMFSFRQDAKISDTYIDRQFNDVYLCEADFDLSDICLQESEVAEICLVSFSEFKKMVEQEENSLVPAYSNECRDLFYFLENRK